jgi:hypothetical protein
MAQIDFAIAFVVVFTMIVYSVFIVSSTITKDFNYFNEKEIEVSQDSLTKQLFEVSDNKSLVTNFKRIQVSFEEIGGYQHTETMDISIKPIMEEIKVYNQTMHEIASTNTTDGSYANISFDMQFSANQINYVNIFYLGGKTEEIIFNNNVAQTNVTASILSEEDVAVLSQDRCNYLKSLDYDAARNSLGFTHRFRIDNYCVYGQSPPAGANIISKSFPVLVENTSGTIYPEQVTLMVWW